MRGEDRWKAGIRKAAGQELEDGLEHGTNGNDDDINNNDNETKKSMELELSF